MAQITRHINRDNEATSILSADGEYIVHSNEEGEAIGTAVDPENARQLAEG